MAEPTSQESNRKTMTALIAIVAFPFVLGAIGWAAVYEDEFRKRINTKGKMR